MNRPALAWLFGSALNAILLSGCGRDDSDEIGTGPSDSTDESTSGTSGTEASESGTPESSGGEGGESNSTTSSTADGTETDSDPCADNPGASACETCLADSCCEQLMACESSESCTCMVECIEEGNDQLTCLLECDLDLPDLAYTQYSTCVQTMCLQECA
jgi:hypothetical protein